MTGTEKVCPNCGNEYFTQVRTIKQEVSITGEGKVIDNCDSTLEVINVDPKVKCSQCDVVHDSLENLVDESYFHEVIANGNV